MESKLAQDTRPSSRNHSFNNHQTLKCKVPPRFRHQTMCQCKLNLGPELMRMSTNSHQKHSISIISVWIENQVLLKMVLQLFRRRLKQTTFSALWNKNGQGRCSAPRASRCKERNLTSLIKIYKRNNSLSIVLTTIWSLSAKIINQSESRCSLIHRQRKRTSWPSRSKNCNLT